VLLLAGPLFAACAARDRRAVLESLVRGVVAEMARDLLQQTRALHSGVGVFAWSPSLATRAAARQRFAGAALAWKRAQAFRSGPFIGSQAFPRAAFWPASVGSIDKVLAAPDVNEQLVEGLGVDARGLWALEYVLFAPRFEPTPTDDKLRSYARELSANVLGYAERLARQLGDAREFARAFAEDDQRSVAALGAQSVDTLEIARGKLERAARAVAQGTAPELAIEGYYSRTSTDALRALLIGTQAVFRGGLEELASRVEPEVSRHVRDAFAHLHERTDALGPELDLAAATRPEAFRAAQSALAQLKHVYEVELRSALEA
jgi:predicted lipoprotein